MRKYIYIGCGSFIGAMLRYLIKNTQIYNYHENIPLNTLLINVFGAFLMAFVLTIVFEESAIRLGITTGFLGAFTTFSTLCKEIFYFMQNGDYFSAILYLTISVVLGLGVSYMGIVLAREINIKLLGKGKIEDMIKKKEV